MYMCIDIPRFRIIFLKYFFALNVAVIGKILYIPIVLVIIDLTKLGLDREIEPKGKYIPIVCTNN